MPSKAQLATIAKRNQTRRRIANDQRLMTAALIPETIGGLGCAVGLIFLSMRRQIDFLFLIVAAMVVYMLFDMINVWLRWIPFLYRTRTRWRHQRQGKVIDPTDDKAQ